MRLHEKTDESELFSHTYWTTNLNAGYPAITVRFSGKNGEGISVYSVTFSYPNFLSPFGWPDSIHVGNFLGTPESALAEAVPVIERIRDLMTEALEQKGTSRKLLGRE